MALQRPKGTQDHLPDTPPSQSPPPAAQRASAHTWLLATARQVLERAGAQSIDTPIFEEAELVRRGVGDSSDIVRKEMFRVTYFGDHGNYILRPEGTAGIMRAYLENGLKQLPSPLKLWTHGPMFRAENVQKGRLRQFHQLNYELIGSDAALADAEAIALMLQVVAALGLRGVQLKLGSVGDPADRVSYNAYLREVFTPHLERLSDDSRDRLERNPLRILDSKSAGDQALIAELGVRPLLESLSGEAAAHFEQVRAYLDAWHIKYQLDPNIVRGLDYYRRTAWELHHQGVGAKSALGGGGRYDGLSAELGGPVVAAVGWALGMERLLIALDAEQRPLPSLREPLQVFVASLSEFHLALAAQVAQTLRRAVRAEFAYRALKPGQLLREAERRGAVYAAIIGESEADSGLITLKHLSSGAQRQLALSELLEAVQRRTPDLPDPDLLSNLTDLEQA